MTKIYKLKNERAEALKEMKKIVNLAVEEGRAKNEDENARYNELDTKVEGLDAAIREIELQEELNKREAETAPEERKDETKSISVEFRDWLVNSVEKNEKATFRADPIITSTQTGVINKTVANSVDILTSPGEAWLRELGVSFYPGLTGNFVVPAMAENTAKFMLESSTAESANMAHEALTLTARRVTHKQSISRETLAQTNPAIYSSILQNLVNGVWNAVTNDVFDQLETDAATQKTTTTVAALAYADIVKMEASIGGLSIGSAAYVTTPTTKAYLKTKPLLGTDNGPAWSLTNELNGYKAYGVPAANAGKLYFGDFSRVAVGQWGGLEIIVDPYTNAGKGQIDLTVIALFDTGVTNKRAFCWGDVSAGL